MSEGFCRSQCIKFKTSKDLIMQTIIFCLLLVWAFNHTVVELKAAKLHTQQKQIMCFYQLVPQKQQKLQQQLQQKQSPSFLCLSGSIQTSTQTHIYFILLTTPIVKHTQT